MHKGIIVAIWILLLEGCSCFLCGVCVVSLRLTQMALISFAPESVAREVLAAVCERQYDSMELCSLVSRELTPIAVSMLVKRILKEGKMCGWVCDNYVPLTEEIMHGICLAPYQKVPYRQYTHELAHSPKDILHLTDIHLDLNYKQGASTVCEYPICCHSQNESGLPELGAGHFGNAKCDTPLALLDSALSFIKESLSPQVVIITGDFSAHNQWEKSQEGIRRTREFIQERVRPLGILISTPGNNEYLPDHQANDLEELISVHHLLGDSPFTVITLNTLTCDNMNLYLLGDQTAPLRQLTTFAHILSQSALPVYIVGHISPFSLVCSSVYGDIFRAIISTYRHLIKGQFYGHTHNDQFVITTFKGAKTGYALQSGGFSPLTANLARFRLYHMQGHALMDYTDYHFSLTELKWAVRYNFKQLYELPAISPIDEELLGLLYERMKANATLAGIYSEMGQGRTDERYLCGVHDQREENSRCLAHEDFRRRLLGYMERLQGHWGGYI